MDSSPPDFKLSSTQTALALIVPSHLQPEINAIRKIHDKAYRKWEPHINILYPFVDTSLLSSAITTLHAHLSENPISPFSVKIDDVGIFEHTRSATVFLKPAEESGEKICGVRRQLVAALGRIEGEGTREGVFKPHLTVGQEGLIGPTKARLVQKVGKLVGVEWEVGGLVVLRRETSGEMSVVEEISLLGEGSDETESGFTETKWRKCYHFSPGIGWKQEHKSNNFPSDEWANPTKFAIASYNLMSEPNAPKFSNRLLNIVEAISKAMLRTTSPAQVLCLQEVDEEMLSLLLRDVNLQELLPFSTHSPSSLLPSRRNQVTLSNAPFSYYSLQFEERHKLALIVSFRDTLVQVANVHLTRALTDEAVATKKRQMEILTNFLLKSPTPNKENIFAAGDFNLTTSSKTIEVALARKLITLQTAQCVREVIDPEVWDDAFLVAGDGNAEINSEDFYEGERGATFDRLINPLASMSKVAVDDRPQRYDRIIFHRGRGIHPVGFEIFGRPAEDGAISSDHFGVCGTFQIEEENGASENPASVQRSLENIKIADDSADIRPLIRPYLPKAADRKQREEALELLHRTLCDSQSLADLILAPLGSYAMDTYFMDSDVDVLGIASVSPQEFFNFATEQLRTIVSGNGKAFKGIHFVNSVVSIIEVSILGIKFDIQYCQAAEVVKRYHSKTPPSPLETLIFDTSLISTLPPSALRPLNTYRSTIYLLTTLPSLDSYRLSHRFLALYLKHHGLYSAKFGYLGGIHLSLLLNRVIKLMPFTTPNSLTPATIIKTFFEYYSTFNWAEDSVLDPELEARKGIKVERTAREAIVIQALHLPAARPNVAASCTRLSAHSISSEFARAKAMLERGDWEACLGSNGSGASEFLSIYGAYVRISVEAWDIFEVGGEIVRDIVGGVESRIVRLLVELGRIGGLEARAWPERFWAVDEVTRGRGEGFKGFYLVGVKAREESDEKKKLVSGKVMTVVRAFETSVRQATSLEEENMWIGADVISRKKVAGLRLTVDRRDWVQGY